MRVVITFYFYLFLPPDGILGLYRIKGSNTGVCSRCFLVQHNHSCSSSTYSLGSSTYALRISSFWLGIKINQLDMIDAYGYSRSKISSRAVEAYLIQVSFLQLVQKGYKNLFSVSSLNSFLDFLRYYTLVSFMLILIREILLLIGTKHSYTMTLVWWETLKALQGTNYQIFFLLPMKRMQKRSTLLWFWISFIHLHSCCCARPRSYELNPLSN